MNYLVIPTLPPLLYLCFLCCNLPLSTVNQYSSTLSMWAPTLAACSGNQYLTLHLTCNILHPSLVASNVFCVHNCKSSSNDYAAVECSNNQQAQLHTRVSVPYWFPDIWQGLELLWDIQFGLQLPLLATGQ